MSETRRNLAVGLFVLVGLLGLGGLIVLYGQERVWFLATPEYTLRAEFPRASGIRPGTQATVGGIPIGRVSGVMFADPTLQQTNVVVTIQFDADYAFRTGTEARTVDPGLGMGRPPIEIIPGQGDEVLAADAVISGQITSAMESLIPQDIYTQFSELSERLSVAAESMQPVMVELHELLQRRSPAEVDAGIVPGNLASSATRLDESLRHLNEVLGDPDVRSKVREFVDNLHAMSVDGREITSDFKAAAADARDFTARANELADTTSVAITDAKAKYDEVAVALQRNLTELGAVLTDLRAVSASVRRGEGTVGKALRDDRLYEAMVLTFARLTDATEDLRVLLQEWQQGRIKVGL